MIYKLYMSGLLRLLRHFDRFDRLSDHKLSDISTSLMTAAGSMHRLAMTVTCIVIARHEAIQVE